MIWGLLLLTGLSVAGKWDGKNTDVVVGRDVPLAQEAVFASFSDLNTVQTLFPADCVEDWILSGATTGVGATFRVTYHLGPLKRRLTGRIQTANPSYVVELDHDGKKGFVTQIALAPSPTGGTQVKLGTYIAAPPWPFKGMYFNKIRPLWLDCYERSLDNLVDIGA